MKFATFLFLGILLLGSFPSMKAAEKADDPAGVSQVAMAFTGGSVYTPTGNICLFYPVLLGDLNLDSLFESVLGAPKVDKEHAYLIWVSDYSMVPVTPFQLKPAIPGLIWMALVPTGTATIYFSNRPDLRNWTDLTNRSTWGEPVATFVRKAGLFQSIDGGISGTAVLTSELVSSKPFRLNGKMFNFRDLMPHGMTCIEAGLVKGNSAGDDEAGTCIAIGDGK
ncbi:MAG: hypothetical protein ABSH05_13130 [Bryobacteraceae bacterium]|jgi:hypothetical protein